MPDIINLLSDAVANQIAAGEVIQRPASVIKELLENSIDAGASEVKVILKDAGKSLIQVIDNGSGMSDTDARMSFERHATSKINHTDNLFAIKTMGFRGEALASIAAIADVELKTRLHNEELGTRIHISGSQVHNQEPVNCPAGANFIVKNLFYNVPARRKFLKSHSTELKHIITEFQRVALPNPDVLFTLYNNQAEIFHLPPDNIKKRVVAMFGKQVGMNLIPIHSKTNLLELSGFIGSPDIAKKKYGDQYFFVNKRFMRHPYFHKALTKAYEKVLPSEYFPFYFIYLNIDSEKIDINIHPTKTEVKFEDEQAIWHIIEASVKQTLGKHNIVPSLDFENEGIIDIPVFDKNREVRPPEIPVNPDYNPFNSNTGQGSGGRFSSKENINQDWERLYEGFLSKQGSIPSDITSYEKAHEKEQAEEHANKSGNFLQIKNKYIVTPVKSGVMMIDQKRAHERILFEKYLDSLNQNCAVTQQDLFPETIELAAEDVEIMKEIHQDLSKLGFDIREFGGNAFVLNGYPSDLDENDPVAVIHQLLNEYKETMQDVKIEARERIAYSLAKASGIPYGKNLQPEEMQVLVDKLFACNIPNISPGGMPSLTIMSQEEIDKKFK